MNQRNDSFLEFWELDHITRKAKEKYASLVDFDCQKVIEKQVSQYIRDHFSFAVFIVKSGLWLVNELYKIPFDAAGVEKLSILIRG